MSARALGIAVAALTAVLWAIGAIEPAHHGFLTSHDLRWYFFPLYEAFYGGIRAGTPTAWNPYQLCGMPFVGTLQAGFFYPFHVLYLALPTPWALAASTALHVALMAGGAAAFARRAGLSAPASILAAAVFAMTGMVRQWQFWPYFLEASAWIPVGALGVLDVTGEHRARGVWLLALATAASCLAGCPQVTVFAGYTWFGLLIARLAAQGGPLEAGLRAAGTAATALVLGGMLAAVALLPAYETSKESVRQMSTLDAAYLYPVGGIPGAAGIADIWLETGSHMLVPAFLLVPFAVLGGLRWLTVWAMAFGALALLLALGPVTPAIHLYFLLPGLAWFRVPYRLLPIAGFCAGILAGTGLDALARPIRLRWAPAAVVAALLVALVQQGLGMPPPAPPLPYREDAVPWTATQRAAYQALAERAGDQRAWPYSPGILSNAFPPKLPSLTHLRSIEDYEPLVLRRQADFFVYFMEGSTVFRQLNSPFEGRMRSLSAPLGREPPAARRRLLDLAATRFVLMPTAMRIRPDVIAFVREARLVARPPLADGIELFENPHALPRAYVTYAAKPAPVPRELLALIAREDFDPLVESFVEGEGFRRAPDAPPRGAPATIVRDEAQLVEVRASLAAPGLVVLADTFASGWRATVDGVEAPLLATNHLFRGVPAPAGDHLVRFEYHPRTLRLGAAISLAAALGLAALAWRARHPPRSCGA